MILFAEHLWFKQLARQIHKDQHAGASNIRILWQIVTKVCAQVHLKIEINVWKIMKFIDLVDAYYMGHNKSVNELNLFITK